jgi:hypothetical protein
VDTKTTAEGELEAGWEKSSGIQGFIIIIALPPSGFDVGRGQVRNVCGGSAFRRAVASQDQAIDGANRLAEDTSRREQGTR